MQKINIIELEKDIEKKLKIRYPDDTLCNQYAWWMLESITSLDKVKLISKNFIELSQVQLDKLNFWIDRQISESEPLQYLLGSVPFDDLEILVEPPILIPRPETEEMCYFAIETIRNYIELETSKKLTILDIGTGSGCIALTLAKAFEKSTIYACDISEQALELTQKNAKLNNIKNIKLIKSNVYSNIPKDIKFDLIISNPPYISQTEFDSLDKSVKNWEDKNALLAQDNGLEIIKKIISGAPKFLRPRSDLDCNKERISKKECESKNRPNLIIEIGYKQGDSVKKLYIEHGFTDIFIKKDLEGKDRFAIGSIF